MEILAVFGIAAIVIVVAVSSTKRLPNTITGRAYVIDGDTIRVSRYTVRLSGLDAPEVDQRAAHQHGYWFNQGKRVKSSLIGAIGGKTVSVRVEGSDKYNRIVGTVMCDGKDVGEWLVRNGYAVAAFSDQYIHVEREARRARRGMWGHARIYHPAAWRRGDVAERTSV